MFKVGGFVLFIDVVRQPGIYAFTVNPAAHVEFRVDVFDFSV